MPVYRHQERLNRCLEALSRQTYPKELLEIVVVDNDPEAPLPDLESVRLVREGAPGSYAARNAGVRVSTGEILAFTDADCLPDPEWIAKGVTHLTHTPECGMVGGKIEIAFADPQCPSAPELYEKYTSLRQADYLRTEHFAATANLFTFRAVFDAVGPFLSHLKSGGDVEWGQRVFAAGYRQVFAASAVVRHPARQTLKELVLRCRRIAAGRMRLARRRHGRLAARLSLYKRGAAQALSQRSEVGTLKTAKVFGIAFVLRLVEWSERGRGIFGASGLR